MLTATDPAALPGQVDNGPATLLRSRAQRVPAGAWLTWRVVTAHSTGSLMPGPNGTATGPGEQPKVAPTAKKSQFPGSSETSAGSTVSAPALVQDVVVGPAGTAMTCVVPAGMPVTVVVAHSKGTSRSIEPPGVR